MAVLITFPAAVVLRLPSVTPGKHCLQPGLWPEVKGRGGGNKIEKRLGYRVSIRSR